MVLLYVVLLSAAPFLELRGAIPFGIAAGLDYFTVFLVATTANIIIIPVIYMLFNTFFKELYKFPYIGSRFEKTVHKAHQKSEKYLDKYGYLGLTLFVSIPLPGSGAYTGSIVANFLEMDTQKAMLAIATGVFVAGVLVTLISIGFLESLQFLL
ncbi:MAG: small multi-drug export protein [Candidatus Pacebacteria bacterium]|jgi:uncharacterized membrane protein|nr:small multidrug export protein [Euryarchaeota archaeon]MDP6527266.1 small multi-drug export protein [Candidatus Paceibacterota bacterium]|tara:strand:+ start:2161 stop:2622 length:462 start_codon:yes stop_codon:yes gene_type:complete